MNSNDTYKCAKDLVKGDRFSYFDGSGYTTVTIIARASKLNYQAFEVTRPNGSKFQLKLTNLHRVRMQ